MDGYGDVVSALTLPFFLETLKRLTHRKRLWVAFSGGLDSHVLLDLCVQIKALHPYFELGALHIHHGINPAANDWVLHCQTVCLAYGIPLEVNYVDGRVVEGKSPEAVAREARFAAFKAFLAEKDVLLLAHHATDQAETILLRLLRGTGPLGLGGILEKATLGESELIRPLLNVSKEAIRAYANERSLNWVEDDSNLDVRFDRNFLRHRIMPLLTQRWTKSVEAINRAGALCVEAARASEAMAKSDFEQTKLTGEAGDAHLSVSLVLQLDRVRRFGVIRYWLQSLKQAVPSYQHMKRIDKEILNAKWDSKPRLKIGDYEIFRAKDRLWVIAKG